MTTTDNQPIHPLLEPVIRTVFADDPEFSHYKPHTKPDALADYIFATPDDPKAPKEVFPKLRWGGQFVFASPNRQQVTELAHQFLTDGFTLEHAPHFVRKKSGLFGIFSGKTHYFVARKVDLLEPGEFTDRFTYHVSLTRHAMAGEDKYVVCKQIPTLEHLVNRLKSQRPELGEAIIEQRARRFIEKILPIFLTREAAILKILQEHLPSSYAARVPRLIDMEKDKAGFVRLLRMNWLRNGGQPLTQLEFAMQAADLLRAVHDNARVIHLDLRLDNFIISERGVGFIDFGSSVRVNEDFAKSPLLSSLYGELMKTSEIQIMLDRMTRSGMVTAEHFCNSRGKIDKSVDVFYLALQFNSPHENPDLKDLIRWTPESSEAKALSGLVQQTLQPQDPVNPTIKSAKDILRELELIERDLTRTHRRTQQVA